MDASAIMAILNAEPGQDEAVAALPDALVSAVNLSEVVAKLSDRGMEASDAFGWTLKLGITVVPFDAALARAAGALRSLTRIFGLSLADRACLALGQQKGALVLTTDRAWIGLGDALGLRIRNIRPVG